MAIYESIRRRLERQQDLLKELEDLPPAQRARRLAQLQGRLADVEQDEDDLDDAERDQLVDQFTASVGTGAAASGSRGPARTHCPGPAGPRPRGRTRSSPP